MAVDGFSGRANRFGFVTYDNPAVAELVMTADIQVDGSSVDAEIAAPTFADASSQGNKQDDIPASQSAPITRRQKLEIRSYTPDRDSGRRGYTQNVTASGRITRIFISLTTAFTMLGALFYMALRVKVFWSTISNTEY